MPIRHANANVTDQIFMPKITNDNLDSIYSYWYGNIQCTWICARYADVHWNKKSSDNWKYNIVGDTRETMVLLESTWHLWGVLQHRQQVAIFHCLFNCWFKRRSKKTSKLHVTGLCAWHSPVTSVFLAQKASNAENVSIWRRHHK